MYLQTNQSVAEKISTPSVKWELCRPSNGMSNVMRLSNYQNLISSCKNLQQVIEAAAGATVAALFTEKMAALPASIKKVAVISCGGNVDIDNLPWYESYVNPFKMGDII